MTEVELCNIVKASNLFPEFTLHEEVGMDINGNSCDLVYENGDQVFCIEAKLHFNFEVLAQACRWRDIATASFIAVPSTTIYNIFHSPKKTILNELDLGLIVVYDDKANFPLREFDPFDTEKKWFCSNLLMRPADLEFWKPLFERVEKNETPAGSKLGKRSTPFTRTVDALKRCAKEHPDYNLKQLLTLVDTHYSNKSSAESCIRRYAKVGIIEKFWRE